MKVCVTGGRDYAARAAVFEFLDGLHGLIPITQLAHGHCRTGADAHADAWCLARGVEPVRYPADWYPNGQRKLWRGAGPARNARMLREFRPVVLVAFPGGSGTAGCVRIARELRIPVLDLRNRLVA